jgi:predicted NAD/FAD-dependent oxidoreductase
LREDTGAGPTLDDEASVKKEMNEEFVRILSEAHGAYQGLDVDDVLYSSVMVWDHARPKSGETEMQTTHLLDEERRAGVCGDFFAGGVEDQGSGAGGVTGVEAAAIR